MNKTELDKIIASAIKSALAESEPKAKASGKATKTGKATVRLEQGDREGIIRAVKVWEGGGHRSLASLSKENWILVREALKNL